MALAEILDGLRGLIAAATPGYAPGEAFTLRPLEDREPIELRAAECNRLVEVVPVALFEGPNITGGDMRFQSSGVEVRVTYAMASWTQASEPVIAASSDVKAIIDATRAPSTWSTFAFEVTPDANAVRLDPIDGETAGPVAYILTIPYVVEWEVT